MRAFWLLSLGLFAIFFGATTARAATYTAASCNRADVNAVINGPTHTAVDGDTIMIPAGSCTWTSGVTVPGGIGISIIGAGTSDAHNPSGTGATTTIIDNYVTSPSYLFYFRPSYGASPSRLSSMTLSPQPGLSHNSLMPPIAFQGTCTASGCPDVRADHLVFPASPSWGGMNPVSGTMIVADNVFGVLDHNSAYLDDPNAYYEFLNFNHSAWQGVGQYGDNSWASPNTFGTNQALYVEANFFETHQNILFPVTESEGGFGYTNWGGGRVVCRFNTGVGVRGMCVNHGTESGGRMRGGRQMEFYKNSMSCPSSAYPACWNNGMLLGAGARSGSLLAIANSFSGGGINSFASIAEYRAFQNFPPWQTCDGAGPYDSNDPTTYFSGTIASVSGSNPYTITVNGTPGWTNNQWVNNGAPYNVHDATINNGSEITGNGSNTLTVTAWTSIAYAPGDTLQIRRAYACIDQSSRIGGTLLSGDPPTPNNSSGGWQSQTLDPVYEAADTLASGSPVFGAINANTARLIANRDYYGEVSQLAQTSPTSPFNGTVGTGYGTLSDRPTTCTPGVGFWSTDQGNWNQSGSGGQGQLYVCSAPNTWTLYFTPYAYPHPLISGTTPPPPAPEAPWSDILDPSRAIDWTTAGFTIPTYTTNCPTQPSLVANDPSAAAANATAIQNALASCDATHNVVALSAGTYYVAGFNYGAQGKQVLRGAGPNATTLYMTTNNGCAGLGGGLCMEPANWNYSGGAAVLPPNGTQQCQWTAGYAQGTTAVTLSNCPGGPPPVNQMLILDQANDTSDTGGVYMCDGSTPNCTYEGVRNSGGRIINGISHSELQVVYVTGVTAAGAGSYSVTISPGIYFTNIRSTQDPGAWWAGFVQNDGIENLTLDYSQTGAGVTMFSCYQCWMKNVRNIKAGRAAVEFYQSAFGVIRDSYFYGAQSHAQTSYTIEGANSSGFLIENNIMQQPTITVLFSYSSAGNVVNYNFGVGNIFGDGTWTWGMDPSHATANNFNLLEGNNSYWVDADNASGPGDQVTVFRNLFSGLNYGHPNASTPVILAALVRGWNFLGNVLGTPGYHTQYQAYATATTAFSGSGAQSIYNLGAGGTGGACALAPPQSTLCEPLVPGTLMRWGNYDTVTGGIKWDSAEASPAAVPYVNANFMPSYFSSLAHQLPASLYYSSKPSWWPAAKAWPPVGPDVSSGNLGICGGTYAGAQATNSTQCTGGALTSAWAAHAHSIPAQDCYLNVMHGPPDGTGGLLSFDADLCYGSGAPQTSGRLREPTGLRRRR